MKAPGNRVGDEAADTTLARAGWDVFVRVAVIVFHMKMCYMIAHARPCGADVGADFQIVGRVERVTQRWQIDGFDHVGDALGRVAIDSLFVFEDKLKSLALGGAGGFAQAADDFVAMRRWVSVGGYVKAEDANSTCAVEIRQVHGGLEAAPLRLEWIGDGRLADGRADGADSHAAFVQHVAKVSMLIAAEIEDVGAVDRAKLDVADGVGLQARELFFGVGGNLVGKRAEVDHFARLSVCESSMSVAAGYPNALHRIRQQSVAHRPCARYDAAPAFHEEWLHEKGVSMGFLTGVVIPFAVYWLIWFAVCYVLVEFAQGYLYDEATPSAGLKVAIGSFILAAFLTWARPSYESMFSHGLPNTLALAIVWFVVFTLILRFHPMHAFGISLAALLVLGGASTLAISSLQGQNAGQATARAPSKPLRKSLGPAAPAAPVTKDAADAKASEK